jgi:hypothetical protein
VLYERPLFHSLSLALEVLMVWSNSGQTLVPDELKPGSTWKEEGIFATERARARERTGRRFGEKYDQYLTSFSVGSSRTICCQIL